MQRIKNFFFYNTSEKQTVVKNTAWLTVSEIVVRLIRFILILWVARILGAEGWGLFSYTLSFVGLVMTFSDLGMTTLVTREFSAQKQSWIRTILVVKIILVILSIITSIIIGVITQSAEVLSILPLVIIILAADSVRGIASAFIRAREKMEQEAAVQLVTNISIVGFSFLFLSLQPTTYSLAMGYTIGNVIGLCLALAISGKTILSHLSSDTKITIAPVLTSAWPIAVLILAMGIITNIDSVMIGWWLTISDVGYYATAQRLIQFGLVIPSLFVSALFPTLNKIYHENKERFTAIAQKSFSALLILAMPMVVGGIIIARPLVTLLFSAEFLPSVPALQILLVGSFALFPLILYNALAIIINKQNIIAKNTVFAIIVSIILNALLIPKFGIVGASIGTVITHWFILITNILLVGIPMSIRKKTIFWVLLGTSIMSAIVIICMRLNINPVITIVTASIFYGLFLIIVKEPIVQSFIPMFIHKKTP